MPSRSSPYAAAGHVVTPARLVSAHRLAFEPRSEPLALVSDYSGPVLLQAIAMQSHRHLYLRRVTDRLSLEGGRALHSLTYEIRLDDGVAAGTDLLLPIAISSRHLIRDDLAVTVPSGPQGRRLTSDEERAFTQVVIRTAFDQVVRSSPECNPAEADFHRNRLTKIPYSEPRLSLAAVNRAMTWLRDCGSNLADVDQLFNACLFFVRQNVVAVTCQAPHGRTLVLERETDATLPASRQIRHHFIRKVLGRKPHTITIPITDVTDAMSYHVFLKAPAQHHIHAIQVLILPDRTDRRRQARALDERYYRVAGAGTDQLHVYFHPSTEAERNYLRKVGVGVTVKLFEDLPGTIIAAWLTTLLMLTTVLIVNLGASHLLPSQPSSPPTLAAAFPAVLLTLPGIAALVFRKQDEEAVVNSPISSALAPIFSTVAACTLALAYLAEVLLPRKNHRVFFWLSWPVFAALSVLALFLTIRVMHKLYSELPYCRGDRSVI